MSLNFLTNIRCVTLVTFKLFMENIYQNDAYNVKIAYFTNIQ